MQDFGWYLWIGGWCAWVLSLATLLLLSGYAYVDGPKSAVFWDVPLRRVRAVVLLLSVLCLGFISGSVLLQVALVCLGCEYLLRRWAQWSAVAVIYPSEWLWLFDFLRPLLCVVATLLCLGSVYWIDDMSGYPKFRRGGVALVAHGQYGCYFWPTGQWLVRWAQPEPGDVVLVDGVVTWLGRVVASGAHKVAYRGNSLWLDGEVQSKRLAYDVSLQMPGVLQTECLPSFCYQVWHMSEVNEPVMAELSMKDGDYFVLADNRTLALDSRAWGVVDRQAIRGKLYSLAELVKLVF